VSPFPPGVRVFSEATQDPRLFVIRIFGPAGEDHRDAVQAALQSRIVSLTRVETTPAAAEAGRFVLLARVI